MTSASSQAIWMNFPGYYQTGDAGYMDDNGYLYIMSRTDDIINVAGHRLSTGAMEEVLAAHPDVAECAVIGIADKLKGQLPCGFVVFQIRGSIGLRLRSRRKLIKLVSREDRACGSLQDRCIR